MHSSPATDKELFAQPAKHGMPTQLSQPAVSSVGEELYLNLLDTRTMRNAKGGSGMDSLMVKDSSRATSHIAAAFIGRCFRLAALLFAAQLPTVDALFAQDLPPVVLEAPILPDTEEAAPVVGTSLTDDVAQTSFNGCMSCGSIGCNGCESYGPGYACPPTGLGMWIRADYLIWYEKESDVVPLVTTSTGFPVDPADLLTLGTPETQIVFGNEQVDDNPLDGWRLEVGAWLDAAATFGIFGRYMEAGGRNLGFNAGPNDFNFLGIPFFDPDIADEDALDLTIPNQRLGLVGVSLEGDVKSWEILYRRLVETGSNYRLDWVYGYRNFTLDETLRLTASTLVTDAAAGIVGTQVDLNDQFDVENRFHGIDLGITGHSHQGCWSLDFLAKVALGVMEQEVDVTGAQLISVPNLDVTRNVGGLFSQESNIGQNDESEFAVIPEIDVNLGYAVTSNLDLTIGYTFIYVNSVVRAGSVIDRTVDPGLAVDLDPVNSNRPQLNFDDEGYFIHGLNLGVTGRF